MRFTRVEREAVLRSVIGSEALAGFTVPREVAERALDELENQPPPAVDFPEQLSAHQRIAAHRILFRPAPPEAVSLPEWPDNEEARNG